MRNRYFLMGLAALLLVGMGAALWMPSQSSQANPGTGWRGEYYNNPTFSGTPVVVVTDDQINFNWGTGAPQPGVPADNFSVRWTATVFFSQGGIYRFRAGSDDGIRLYIDDVLTIDDFREGAFRINTRDVQVNAGARKLRVEYFEAATNAAAVVDWALVSPIGTPAPTVAGGHVDFSGRPTAHIAADVLNVRANPSVTASRIAQVYLYESYPILGISQDGLWYLIDLGGGVTGWVSVHYIYRNESNPVPTIPSSQGSSAALPNIEVIGQATSNLKIRVAPRTGEQIGLLPRGEQVRVLGRNSSGSWFYISWNGIEGWVYSPGIRLTNGKVMDLPIR
jgi:uncharacterized protein YgiM (DUF1202 family)